MINRDKLLTRAEVMVLVVLLAAPLAVFAQPFAPAVQRSHFARR